MSGKVQPPCDSPRPTFNLPTNLSASLRCPPWLCQPFPLGIATNILFSFLFFFLGLGTFSSSELTWGYPESFVKQHPFTDNHVTKLDTRIFPPRLGRQQALRRPIGVKLTYHFGVWRRIRKNLSCHFAFFGQPMGIKLSSLLGVLPVESSPNKPIMCLISVSSPTFKEASYAQLI